MLEARERAADLHPGLDQRDGQATWSGRGGILLCRACRQPVTDEASRIAVQGRHAHRRTNPLGVTFEFWCFDEAPGVVGVGQPTTEFAWFPGHAWSFALCAGCGEQLGWLFEGEDRFFGLICQSLEPEADPPPPM